MNSQKKVCRYGSSCFRLNPSHYSEYDHPHLEAIFIKGIDPVTGEYDIPDNVPLEKIKEQLEIYKQHREDCQPPRKIQKTQQVSDSSSVSSSSNVSQSSLKSPQLQDKPGISALEKKQEEKKFFQQKNKEMNEQKSTKDEKLEAAMKEFLPVILPKGLMAEKLKNAPYNYFLTTVTASKETHNDPLSITFQEILDPSLGELESSVQFNFMVDPGWLLAQYAFAKYSQQPLLILYGSDMPGIRDINKKRPNVTALKVQLPTPVGCHHTKMMLLFYKDSSLRVVVSTANLYEDDWDNRVQGVWISDRICSLGEGISYTNHGESSTKFRADLMKYLICYNIPKLQPIIARIRESDFSKVNVFFISSVPGSHRDTGNGIQYGHARVATLLSENSAPIDDSNAILVQCSSIGALGSSPTAYLTGEIAASFKRDSAAIGLRRTPNVKFIYPSLNNVISSYDGLAGGGCLPYNGATHEKQRWLNEFLYQWKASSRNRNAAMPHIKSYCRYSDRGLYWFILTSANMSRSAWGAMNKSNKTLNPTLRINSYEAGVVFFPRVILSEERFPTNSAQQKNGNPIFRLPFDIPPVPYGKDDVPYCAEYLKAYIERHGVP